MPTPGFGEADRGRTLSDRPGGDDLSVLCSNSGNWNEVRDQLRSLGFKLPFVDGEAAEGAPRVYKICFESDAVLPLIDIDAWSRQMAPEREWALDDWIAARHESHLTGPGGVGKSLLAQQLCTCVALGLPFLGVKTEQATPIHVTCEDDTDELHLSDPTGAIRSATSKSAASESID